MVEDVEKFGIIWTRRNAKSNDLYMVKDKKAYNNCKIWFMLVQDKNNNTQYLAFHNTSKTKTQIRTNITTSTYSKRQKLYEKDNIELNTGEDLPEKSRNDYDTIFSDKNLYAIPEQYIDVIESIDKNMSKYIAKFKQDKENFVNNEILNYLNKYIAFKNSSEYNEQYKWDFANKNKGIFNSFDKFNENMSNIGTQNFQSFFMRNNGINWMLAKHDETIKSAFKKLIDENKTLLTRINDFRKIIKDAILNDESWENKAICDPDIGTASFYLFAHDYTKYLLYTKITPFNNFAKKFDLKEIINGNKEEKYINWHNYCFEKLIPIMNKVLNKECSLLDAQDFIWYVGNLSQEKSEDNIIEKKDEYMQQNIPLNQILYGPPGTGKTYSTAKLALQIIEPNFVSKDRIEISDKYNDYKKSKQIQFVTFHQSYSYEEFVEGIRPVIADKCDTIIYEPHDGIFKNIVDLAKSEYTKAQIQENIDFSKINVYKMSLGNTSDKNEYNIYDYCIENNCIGLGYGENVDFSSANTKEDILKIYNENDVFENKSQFTVDAVDRFKNWMQKGDLVLISNGNNSIRAIGLITGDYRYNNVAEIKYCQYRDVKWLYSGDDIPKDKFIFKNLSQMSIYQFYKQDLNIEFIQNMLNIDEKKDVKKYVLIIDEINRGDISDIFGELITLLEDTKRTDKENVEVILPYSNKPFSIPPNLYIIGTMNTADRSIALLDIALRRRFDFIAKYPDSSVIGQDGAKTEVEGIDLKLFLDKMNERIEVLFDKDHTIGHSYLMGINNYDDFVYKFKNRILPLLSEYFYNDYDKIAEVLNQDNIDDDEWSDDTTQIILKRLINDRPLYKINEKYPIDAFKKVCE